MYYVNYLLMQYNGTFDKNDVRPYVYRVLAWM